jgi:hypothetical protein
MKSDMEQNNLEPTGEFAASIRDFRSAVTHVAERETSRPVTADWIASAQKRRRSTQRMTLAWGWAALLCLATLPFFSHSRQVAIHPAAPAVAAVAPAPESDTALLEQVDMDVSESVPPPLAPLADLDSLDTTSSDTLSGSSANGKSLPRTESTNATQ